MIFKQINLIHRWNLDQSGFGSNCNEGVFYTLQMQYPGNPFYWEKGSYREYIECILSLTDRTIFQSGVEFDT